MPGPLDGIRVLELGFWVAGPAAAGILADWGAEVIKIEPPTGDPFRGIFISAAGIEVPFNPPFELDNRGKRSIALDLDSKEGQAITHRLLAASDVFVTNLRPSALARLGLDYESLSARYPRLVYCSVTGYGLEGPEGDRPAYDVGAYWARAGIAAALVPCGAEPPQQRGGMGDHTAGVTAVAAICAALFSRERTGTGQLVSTSLLRVGLYVLGWDVNTQLRFGAVNPPWDRRTTLNPLINCYRAGDQHWLWLLGLQGDRHWPDLLRAVERPELRDDPRFRDLGARRDNAPAMVAILDEVFATRPRAAWAEALDRAGMWWAPVHTFDEIPHDPQLRPAGALVSVPVADGEAEMLASPADFSATPWAARGTAPECGQHTEEILLELGYDWDGIAQLKEKAVIP